MPVVISKKAKMVERNRFRCLRLLDKKGKT